MSQITTCPSCGTRFRVVADQLRISDGWVRCGQCQEVFDARNHLDAVAAAVAAPAPLPSTMPLVDAGAPLEAAAPVVPPAIRANLSPEAPAVHSAQEAAPPPGYELPAPQWSDDIDLSEYQAELADAVAPIQAVPVEDAAPAAEHRADDRAWPQPVDVRGPPRPSGVPGAFPALDLSLLEVQPLAPLVSPIAKSDAPATAADGGVASATTAARNVSQNTVSSALDGHNSLIKNEHSAEDAEPAMSEPVPLAERSTDGAASALVGVPSSIQDFHAEPAGVADPADVPAAAEAVRPWDALESAAQKLAQAEDAPERDMAVTAATHTRTTSQAVGMTDVDAEAALEPSLEPSFVRDARRKAWWQKPVVRVIMGAGVVVLPVALALQVALHERNALAAWQPSLRPALAFMCTALQCTLGPRQQIGAMVVSGSTFAKGERERAYQLSLTIHNRASTPVGMPAVELTLTDSQDQAIARKVIQAKELGAPQELKAGAEWSSTLPVTTEGLNLQVSGYRVLLFYP